MAKCSILCLIYFTLFDIKWIYKTSKTHTHSHTHTRHTHHTYIYICVCVCVCVAGSHIAGYIAIIIIGIPTQRLNTLSKSGLLLITWYTKVVPQIRFLLSWRKKHIIYIYIYIYVCMYIYIYIYIYIFDNCLFIWRKYFREARTKLLFLVIRIHLYYLSQVLYYYACTHYHVYSNCC